ncbi:MAG: hypothetical protein OEU57_09730, partial [Desulfuromonadales bacterium]|nr:hypothetical protein [Desulfuromonadales bacterium]
TGLNSSNFDFGSYNGYRSSFNSSSDSYTIGLDISSFVVDTDYLVTATVTSGGLQDSDMLVIRKASSKTIYISDISYEKVFKNLRVYLTVKELTGSTVAGAAINLTLKRDGSSYKNYSITTNANGVADLRVGNAKRGYYTIAVNSISSAGATYDPTLNTTDTGYDVP